MIIEYHRPDSTAEALNLLKRDQPLTLPMGGGTVLSRKSKPDFAVVDLQRLGLDTIESDGQFIQIGASVTLQTLLESDALPESVQASLRQSLIHECGLNVRQSATLGGILASTDGRSPFVTALLALDPRLIWAVDGDHQPLGDYLPLREAFGKGQFITGVKIPVNAALCFETVARSPMDRPLVCAGVAVWPSGRTRVTLGGFGKAPILAMDGPEPGGAVLAAREAYRFAGDAWASAAYRMDVAGKLVQRMLVKEPKAL